MPVYRTSRRARRLAGLKAVTESFMRVAAMGELLEEMRSVLLLAKHSSGLFRRERRSWESYISP